MKTHQLLFPMLALTAAAAATPAHAGLLGSLFGSADAQPQQVALNTAQQNWSLGQFGRVSLVPSEAGSTANQQPLTLNRAVLEAMLESVHLAGGDQPSLFGASEAHELGGVLVKALQVARSDQDVVFVSVGRHGDGVLNGPTAVTARLFVADGALNLIVRDARDDFYGDYKGTGRMPQFQFGSRAQPSQAALRSPLAQQQRADWLRFALNATAQPAAQQQPTLALQPATPAAAATLAPAAAPAAAAPAPAANNAVQRLETLRQLLQRGLITQQEFDAKRAKILDQL